MSLNVEQNIFTRFIQEVEIPNQLSSKSVWHILRDSKERIWLGLLGTGLDLFNPENKTFVNLGPSSNSPHKIDFPNVMTIIEDSDGDIWFGTEGKGLYILDSQTNKILQLAPDSTRTVTAQGLITSIYQDKWEQIWIVMIFFYSAFCIDHIQTITIGTRPDSVLAILKKTYYRFVPEIQ
ncbi:hypothetical protein ES708_29235 [subsurface metagenome]